MASTIVEKATAAVEKLTGSSNGESKSARKKKEKVKAAEAASSTNGTAPAVPQDASNETSVVPDADGSTEHAYVKELQKQIRNINKKLSGMQKTDTVIAENPGVALDDLVAQRKLNNDQRSAALKKPGLQAQLADLEERIEHYRKFDVDYQTKFSKQRDDLSAAHAKEVTSLREQLQVEAASSTASELRKKLLTFSQFLRAAAAKRTVEEEVDSEESRAFEGALLLVYGGDIKAVDTALSIIEGSSEPVPSIEGIPLQVDYAQIKKSSMAHAPFQTEEDWVDRVAEATESRGSDPTLVHAGLTELDAQDQTNGLEEAHPEATLQSDAGGVSGNIAGNNWDTNVAGTTADRGEMEDSYVHVPRPDNEVEIPVETSTQQVQGSNWADDVPTHESSGNAAGETWSSAEPAATNGAADDGFHEVAGRSRGRGGPRGGRGGDGEFRGRGGRRGNFRGRGDGEFRGRGGFRGGRGEGESRGGRGGRGRGGPRGGADGAAVAQS